MGGKSSTHQGPKLFEKTGLDIAITGMVCAGKSSLVNALRGLSDFDEGAAETGVTATTMKPTPYPHPTFSDVTIWDLPGIGTPRFKAEEYLEKVNFSQYDFFIIVASNRFTQYDLQLSHAIQNMKKRFYYVCSQMDESIKNEKVKPDFSEEAVIQKVRKYWLENLEQAGFSSPEIFLISIWHLSKYDFPLLERALENEIKALRRKILRPAVPPDSGNNRSTETSRSRRIGGFLSRTLYGDLEGPEDAMARRHLRQVVDKVAALDNVKLNIAITGVSGAGKSSLINALRNMTDYEEGAAKTGAWQTTMDIHGYPHPLFRNVTLWDLPGIGTPLFRVHEYSKKVNFSQYDFFIIVASDRFTENDILLSREIKQMKKKYYFVRSKIDVCIDSEKRDPSFNKNKTLEKIRNYCRESLRKAGETSPRVFLISRWHLNRYDFPLLQETLIEELDDLKQHALILAMPVFSRKILEQKTAAMKARIWDLAWLACATGAIPVPGLSLVCDIGTLVLTLRHFYKVFGLEEESLRRLAKVVGKDYQVLKAAVKKSPMSSEISPEFVISLLSKSLLCGSLMLVDVVFDFVPVMGSLVGAGTSFVTTYYMLNNFLKDVVEDAENVRATAVAP